MAVITFYFGMCTERYIMPGKEPLRQAVFSKDGVPGGFNDLYTLSGNRSGIAINTNTGDVYYCRIDLFGDLIEKELLFSINDYHISQAQQTPHQP